MRSRRRGYNGFALALVLVAILLVGGCGACATSYYKEDSVRVHVTGKESVATQDGHEYRIYTDGETYIMADSILKGRTATGTDYSRIKVGKTYDCKKQGFRIPLLSEFENLLWCKEVTR